MTSFMTRASLPRPGSLHAVSPHGQRSTLDYAVFGGVLRSELAIPELPSVDGRAPDWLLRVAAPPAPATVVRPIGERTMGREWYRLSDTTSGRRLEYSHGGIFDIDVGGREIVWFAPPEASVELARNIVLGPALAVVLEAGGLLCVHGSAVAIGSEAVAFIAPKHHGKSTLAVALTCAGARLIGDDTLALERGSPPVIRPGVASVRLWADAAAAIQPHLLCRSIVPGVKTTASGFAPAHVLDRAAPLAAIYVLAPAPAGPDARPVWREPLPAAAATIALAHHTKLPDSLIGLRAAAARLASAAAVARAVPTYVLHVTRSFALLPTVVEGIFAWHGAHDAARPESQSC